MFREKQLTEIPNSFMKTTRFCYVDQSIARYEISIPDMDIADVWHTIIQQISTNQNQILIIDT